MEAALRSVRFRGSSQAEIEESELRRLRLLLVGSLNRLQQGHRKTDDGGKLRFGGAKTSLVSPKMSSKWEAKKQQQAATRVGPRLLLFIFLVVFGWAFWLDTALTTLATVNGQPADSPASPAPLEQQPPPNGGQQLEPTGQLESWSVPAASQQQLERAPSGGSSRKAQLAEPENNNQVHRVAVGRSVRFKCTVNEIGAHKLAWFHKDRRLLLALDNKTVAWRERIQVSSQANKVFFLQIDSVQLSDKGQYMCQLSSQPPQSQVHILDVVKSPHIKEQETSINVAPVKEFHSVELRCAADGIPKPVIKWRRESQLHELARQNWFVEESNELGQVGGPEAVPSEQEEEEAQLAAGGEQRSKTEASKPPASNSKQGHQGAPAAGDSSAAGERLSRARRLAGDWPANWQKQKSNSASSDESEKLHDSARSVEIRVFGRRDHHHHDRTRRAAAELQIQDTQTTQSGPSNQTGKGGGFIGEGPVLRLERVSRYDMGFYMCIASNGVPPSVSQRIFLPVSYAPDAPTNEHSSGPPLRTGGLTKLGAPDTPDAGEPQPRAGHSQASDAHRHQQQVVKTTVNAGGQTRSRYRQYKAPRSSSSVSSGGHHFGGCTLGMGELLAVLVAQLVLLRTVGRSLGAHTRLEVAAV